MVNITRYHKINPNDLVSILNSINPSIQFTMKYSKDGFSVLDILIKRNNDKIWMDIYYKPTVTHRCLPFCSNNPTNQPILIGVFHFFLITQNIAKRMYLLHWHVVSA